MQSGLGQPFSGCSEVRAMLRKERSGRGSWLPETDTESNLSHAQFPQEGPGAGIVYISVCGLGEGRGTHRHGIPGLTIALFCGWASMVEVALLK